MENNPKVTIITVIIVLVLTLGGMYVMKNHKSLLDVPRPATPLPEGPNLEQRFEDFLNKFIKDVNEAMIAYKQERKVLVEALGPANLREPAYVEENYQLVQSLLPSLRQRMANVIKIFENAEIEVDELLLNQPEKIQQAILQKWSELKRTHGQNYIDFFTIENDLLSAYESLMAFYHAKQRSFEVDLDTRTVVFNNPEDAAEEERLRQHIKELYAEQEVLIRKPARP